MKVFSSENFWYLNITYFFNSTTNQQFDEIQSQCWVVFNMYAARVRRIHRQLSKFERGQITPIYDNSLADVWLGEQGRPNSLTCNLLDSSIVDLMLRYLLWLSIAGKNYIGAERQHQNVKWPQVFLMNVDTIGAIESNISGK